VVGEEEEEEGREYPTSIKEVKKKKLDYDGARSLALPLALFTGSLSYGFPRPAQRSEGWAASASV